MTMIFKIDLVMAQNHNLQAAHKMQTKQNKRFPKHQVLYRMIATSGTDKVGTCMHCNCKDQ